MKQNKKYLLACFIILMFCFYNSFCLADQKDINTSHCITQFKNGTINWTTGKILATGKASVEDNTQISHNAVPGSARADANRHIIDILKQLIINNSLSVGKYASDNDAIMAGIEKTARDAVITRQYYTSALSVEILIETSMSGGFLQLVLPEKIRQIPQIKIEQPQKEMMENSSYTGLIIDARKLGIEPVLNPVIISEQGDEIYSAAFISREFAVQNGVCKYYCDLDQASKDDRIGRHPLIIKGLRNAGKQNTAIIVSMSDYLILEKITERHTFLKECRVIIVKD
ncbi:MAG: hypothetical protein GY857_04995 [Desulfobacula sp.]|nr:hypothetical protein [Desulfobacula sp.]